MFSFNSFKGGLEYVARVHFCNALVHAIYSAVSCQYSYTTTGETQVDNYNEAIITSTRRPLCQ